jgi:hypothetical protein
MASARISNAHYFDELDKIDRRFREATQSCDWPFTVPKSPNWLKIEPFAARGLLRTLEQLSEEYPVEWLFTGMGTTSSLGGIYAEPGIGKSLMAIAVAMSVVTGRELIPGFKVEKRGQVVFMLAEGQTGFDDRVRATCSFYNLDYDLVTRDILAVSYMIPMGGDGGEKVYALTNEIRLRQTSTTLVIFDNYSHFHSIEGTEENGIEDNNRLMGNIRSFLRALRCAGITIHHANKATGEIRGATSIKANLDYLVKLTRRGDLIESYLEKNRDGIDRTKHALEVVDLPKSAVMIASNRELPPTTNRQGRFPANPKKSSNDLADRILQELGDDRLSCNKLAGALSEKHEVVSAMLRKLVKERSIIEIQKGSISLYSRPVDAEESEGE